MWEMLLLFFVCLEEHLKCFQSNLKKHCFLQVQYGFFGRKTGSAFAAFSV